MSAVVIGAGNEVGLPLQHRALGKQERAAPGVAPRGLNLLGPVPAWRTTPTSAAAVPLPSPPAKALPSRGRGARIDGWTLKCRKAYLVRIDVRES